MIFALSSKQKSNLSTKKMVARLVAFGNYVEIYKLGKLKKCYKGELD